MLGAPGGECREGGGVGGVELRKGGSGETFLFGEFGLIVEEVALFFTVCG